MSAQNNYQIKSLTEKYLSDFLINAFKIKLYIKTCKISQSECYFAAVICDKDK